MNNSRGKNTFLVVVVIVIALALGSAAGYMLKKSTMGSPFTSSSGTEMKKGESGASIYGTKDTKLYPDSATGTVRIGGIDGEGTHHLERPGGPSQNVYITSSSIDLGAIEGKKVTVWGKTYAGNKAGWLMDVGYVEVK